MWYRYCVQNNSWFLIKDRELASKICLNFCPRSNGNLIMILLVKSIEGRIFVNVILFKKYVLNVLIFPDIDLWFYPGKLNSIISKMFTAGRSNFDGDKLANTCTIQIRELGFLQLIAIYTAYGFTKLLQLCTDIHALCIVICKDLLEWFAVIWDREVFQWNYLKNITVWVSFSFFFCWKISLVE